MKKLFDLTRRLAEDNAGQEFFIDAKKAVAGAKNPATGEIVPILSSLIDGNVAAHHGVKVPGYDWRPLASFDARFATMDEYSDAVGRGEYPLEGIERIFVETPKGPMVFRKEVFEDYGLFERES